MSGRLDEERLLARFNAEVKPRLRTALVRLDAEVAQRREFFTSVLDERADKREIAFRVGPLGAQHEIKLVYIGVGRVAVETEPGRHVEHDLDELDQAAVDHIARAWLVEIGIF